MKTVTFPREEIAFDKKKLMQLCDVRYGVVCDVDGRVWTVKSNILSGHWVALTCLDEDGFLTQTAFVELEEGSLYRKKCSDVSRDKMNAYLKKAGIKFRPLQP